MKTPTFIANYFNETRKKLNTTATLQPQIDEINAIRKRSRKGLQGTTQQTATDFPPPVPTHGPNATQQSPVETSMEARHSHVFEHVQDTLPLNMNSLRSQTADNRPQILQPVAAPQINYDKIPKLIICRRCGHYKNVCYNGHNENYPYKHETRSSCKYPYAHKVFQLHCKCQICIDAVKNLGLHTNINYDDLKIVPGFRRISKK